MTFIIDFIKNESGATAIEYGLIAALISVGVITAVTDLGAALKSLFRREATALDGVSP